MEPCAVCGAAASFVCSRCQSTPYCSKLHQVEDWKSHKRVCVAKAAAIAVDPLEHLSEAGRAAVRARAISHPTAEEAAALRVTLGITSRTAERLRLIGEGADLNVKRYGLTALHENCSIALLEVALVIASCPDVDLEAKNNEGRTPLMAAARVGGLTALMTLLLKKGADINAVDNAGATALSLAITRGQPRNAMFLIEKGADVTVALRNPRVDEEDMAEVKAALLAHRAVAAVGGRRTRKHQQKNRRTRRQRL
jgi:ankyrin repeat protein